jgi:hypothetical protein
MHGLLVVQPEYMALASSAHREHRRLQHDALCHTYMSKVYPHHNASNAMYFFKNSTWRALEWNGDGSDTMDRWYQRLGWGA